MSNLNDVLTKLIQTFGGKKIVLSTMEGSGPVRKLEGFIICGCWINPGEADAHFVLAPVNSMNKAEISVPMNLQDQNTWCHKPYEFGKEHGDSVRIIRVEGIESFPETFRSCIE